MEKQKGSTKKSVEVLELLKSVGTEAVQGSSTGKRSKQGDKFSFAFFIIKWLTAV